jgi:hypothetical protein
MPKPEIEEFAKLLVQHVRDRAIQSSDGNRSEIAQHVKAKRWREAAGDSGTLEALGKVMIPDVVDDTLFYLLHAIDEGLIKLSFESSAGRTVSLCKEGRGELAGWYLGTEGWREKYSTERFVDDFFDLR